jgi:hypothetical protein
MRLCRAETIKRAGTQKQFVITLSESIPIKMYRCIIIYTYKISGRSGVKATVHLKLKSIVTTAQLAQLHTGDKPDADFTAPELFPTNVRHTGAGVSYNLGGILGAPIAPYIAQPLAAQGGLPWVGHYVSIASVVGLLGMLAMKETKDMSLS